MQLFRFASGLLLALALLWPRPGIAQSNQADALRAMEAVYERFTRAYRLASVDSVLVLYTDGPLYLPGQGPIHVGREALRSQFSFLDRLRERSATASISFESVERGATADLAWDVGYYRLRVQEKDGTVGPEGRGKFTTIWRRDGAGQWRIHVDSFSPAPPG